MSCIQVTAYQHAFNVPNVRIRCIAPDGFFELHKSSLKLTTCSSKQSTRLPKTCVRPRTGASSYRQCTPVCLFGGKGKSENGNEASPWKSLEKAMGNLKKEQSLEDVLRQQMEKQEYYDDGGSGGNRPGGGGGGDGSGGSEDEGLPGILDELVQVILATIGFIFLYIYIIEGEEINVIVRDYIKFIFGGQKSLRLRRLMYQWGEFYQRLRAKDVYDPYWLEREIINTPTWFDSPAKYRRMFRSYIASRAYSDNDEDNRSYIASRAYSDNDEDDRSYIASRAYSDDDEDAE